MPDWLFSFFVNMMVFVGGSVATIIVILAIIFMCVELYDFFATSDEDLDELARKYGEEY